MHPLCLPSGTLTIPLLPCFSRSTGPLSIKGKRGHAAQTVGTTRHPLNGVMDSGSDIFCFTTLPPATLHLHAHSTRAYECACTALHNTSATMTGHKSAVMTLSIATIVLCCVARVSAFAILPHVSSPRFVLSPLGQEGGWTSRAKTDPRRCQWSHRLSMKTDEGTDGFDPLGFSGGVRRRRAGKSLQAIKIGMDEVLHHQQDEALNKEPPPSTAVAQGWNYWKYRVLLLGVALLWGTNFPAVCSLSKGR